MLISRVESHVQNKSRAEGRHVDKPVSLGVTRGTDKATSSHSVTVVQHRGLSNEGNWRTLICSPFWMILQDNPHHGAKRNTMPLPLVPIIIYLSRLYLCLSPNVSSSLKRTFRHVHPFSSSSSSLFSFPPLGCTKPPLLCSLSVPSP